MLLRLFILAVLLIAPALALAAESLPKALEGVGVDEHLGAQIDLDRRFVDEHGQSVALKNYFRDHKPVLLTLNYYECPMLCGLQLRALVASMRALDWTIGQQFRVVTISFNPKEDATLAEKKRESFLKEYDRGSPNSDDVEWHFLTSPDDAVASLARELGFGYRYDPEQKQYAHPTVLFAMTPDGHIARYLYGLEFKPQDLKFSLIEASQGRTASTVDKVILSCFHYDAQSGRYAPYAFGIMRLGGVLTMLVIGLMLGIFFWRDRHRSDAEKR